MGEAGLLAADAALPGGLVITLQPGFVPLGQQREILPLVTGAAGAGGFKGVTADVKMTH